MVEAYHQHHPKIIGLCTDDNHCCEYAKTIEALHQVGCDCPIWAGGAVLTQKLLMKLARIIIVKMQWHQSHYLINYRRKTFTLKVKLDTQDEVYYKVDIPLFSTVDEAVKDIQVDETVVKIKVQENKDKNKVIFKMILFLNDISNK